MSVSETVPFREYLQKAHDRAIQDRANKEDGRNLDTIHKRCRNGVKANWEDLDAVTFFRQYFQCTGAAGKKYVVRERFRDAQVELFRGLDPTAVARDGDQIRKEWKEKRRYLHPEVVKAIIQVAGQLADWDQFKASYLLLPDNPETELTTDWLAAYWRLRKLPWVGFATSWYLIRNLYGARVFKPDVHILDITEFFFGPEALPQDDLAEAVLRYWPEVCSTPWLLPTHLGELDYILWWYRVWEKEPVLQQRLRRHRGC